MLLVFKISVRFVVLPLLLLLHVKCFPALAHLLISLLTARDLLRLFRVAPRAEKRVHGDLGKIQALERLKSEHVSHNVFEIVAQSLADILLVNLPKNPLIVTAKVPIVLVFG